MKAARRYFRSAPPPWAGSAFAGLLAGLFLIGAVHDLQAHPGALRWLPLLIFIGAVTMLPLALRTTEQGDGGGVRGAARRTRPWIAVAAGGGLLLRAAGGEVSGLVTGFVIGMLLTTACRFWWLSLRPRRAAGSTDERQTRG